MFFDWKNSKEKTRKHLAKNVLDNFKDFILLPASIEIIDLKMVHSDQSKNDFILLETKQNNSKAIPEFYQGFKVELKII